MWNALRHVSGDLRSGVRCILSLDALRGAVVETTWITAHLALYPLGLLGGDRARSHADRFSLQGLPPVQRGLVISDVEAAGTPILLVHGMVDNRSIFTLLRRGLLRRGFGRIIALNYSPLTDDIRSAARRLAKVVEELCADTGYERIHVIGHSMGGLIARYYVQRYGGDARVHTLVTLGSPHGGSVFARLLPHRLFRQLRPGSDVIEELAAATPGCRTRFLAFYSNVDQLIVPGRHARIDHPDLTVRNILVSGVGHMSLPNSRRVAQEICTVLAMLDHDGSTVGSTVGSVSRRTVTGTGTGRASPTGRQTARAPVHDVARIPDTAPLRARNLQIVTSGDIALNAP